jgi:hypothetical protein
MVDHAGSSDHLRADQPWKAGFVFWTVLAVLALIAGALYMLRLRTLRRGDDGLSDDVIRSIENTGRIEVDEPLDLGEIRDEEVRFWEESTWDEPEELS